MKTKKELEQEYINSYRKPNAFCIIIAFLAAGGLIALIYGFAWVMLKFIPELIK